MNELTLGVRSVSSKENERRLPLHPHHLPRLSPEVRDRVFLEAGYGDQFGISDKELSAYVGGLIPRQELIDTCDVILLPKPLAKDLDDLREGQTLWGWPHCVQDSAITQHAIDKSLTLIAFEAMHYWHADGSFNLHVFHENNELAGYSSVLHALQLIGCTGNFGRRLTAAVIGFGATGRGAVTALNAHGVHEVDVVTHRSIPAVASPIHSATMVHFEHDETHPERSHALTDEGSVPLADFIARHDIIVNCVLQDTEAPKTFLDNDDLPLLTPGTLIIDVSCDEGMGFSFAKPTTFVDPMFTVGDNVHYYAVDHSPSYLWNSATWEISQALLPFIDTVLAGPEAWDRDETIKRAIEIRHGVVQNQHILSFQHRSAEYPHTRI